MNAGRFHAATPADLRGGAHSRTASPWRRRELAQCAALTALALAVLFFHLGSYGLWDPDEARYAEIAREMLATGNFVVPHLNFVAYIEKPPLLYWMTSLAFYLLGINELAARLVPAISALAGVILTYWFARREFDHRRAMLAAAILITSPLYAAMAQVLTTDMLLTALLTVAFFTGFLQLREGGRWWIAFYLSMALAVLTKGPEGVALPVLAGILFAWRQRTLRGALARMHPLAGLVLLLAVALPWFAIVTARVPGFLDFYLIREHFRRAFVATYSHGEPFYYYLPVVLGGLLPWSICFPLLLLEGTKGPARSFCSIAAATVLVLFSAANAKLIPYILPALPPLALVLADSILCAVENRSAPQHRPWSTRLVTALGPALCIAALVFLIIGAAAPIMHSGNISLVASVLLAIGVVILIGGAASSAAFLRGRAEAGLSIVVVAMAAALLTGTYGRIAVESLHSYAALGRELAVRVPGATLIDYIRYPQAITFYTRRRVILASPFLSELRFGAEHSADRDRYFLTSDSDLLRLWSRDRSAVLIIDQLDLNRIAPQLGPIRIVAQEGHKLAVASSREPR
jgi:4-amino-4-deoxy-L-arabinose transferase-like glycosyltransferase